MKTKYVLAALLLTGLSSCDKLNLGNEKPITGEPLALTEVGNTFAVTTSVSGVSVSQAEVTDVTDGISTTTVKVNVTNPLLVKWKDSFPYLNNVNGNTAEISISGRVTENGIQSVVDGKSFTLVDYSDGVGTKYKGTVDGHKIEREIVAKSTDDDYSFGWFDIKVYQIEERGNPMPGLAKMNYYTNHKFGIVGVEAVFEDGSI
jgi:hypothetical protein